MQAIRGVSRQRTTTRFNLRMKVDGVDINATSELDASSVTPRFLSLIGRWADGELDIEVHNFENRTGEWIVNPDYTTSPRFAFWDKSTGYFAGDGGILLGQQDGNGKLVISQVTEKYIQGTFEFITRKDVVTGLSKTVTGGEFALKLRN